MNVEQKTHSAFIVYFLLCFLLYCRGRTFFKVYVHGCPVTFFLFELLFIVSFLLNSTLATFGVTPQIAPSPFASGCYPVCVFSCFLIEKRKGTKRKKNLWWKFSAFYRTNAPDHHGGIFSKIRRSDF